MILLAAILIVAVLLLIRWFTKSDSTSIRKVFKILLVVTALSALVVLILTGRLYAIIIGAVALTPLAPFLIRFFNNGAEADIQDTSSTPYTSQMTQKEALHILGLTADATAEDIKKSHKALIRKLHPDQGGSDYLTQKINQARDVLLGK